MSWLGQLTERGRNLAKGFRLTKTIYRKFFQRQKTKTNLYKNKIRVSECFVYVVIRSYQELIL